MAAAVKAAVVEGSTAGVDKACSAAAAASAVRYLHLRRLHFLSESPAARPSEAPAARVTGACQQLCENGRFRDSKAIDGHPPAARNWGRGLCHTSGLYRFQAGEKRLSIPVERPGLRDFMRQGALASPDSAIRDCKRTQVPYLDEEFEFEPKHRGRMYVETYGCQMNVNDMEVVLAIMKDAGFSEVVSKPEEADIIFINTCAIRENAEHKVWHRLGYFKHLKTRWNRNIVMSGGRPASPPKVAVLGCMAERLKEKLIESDKLVDVVCGPDAYRDLPRLLAQVDEGHRGVNTLLSLEETYADVSPVRISKSPVSAFVSIMRGCNNMCSYCIVPFTRGRERSRPVDSIVREVGELWEQGVKEVILLGQNVNSYNDTSGNSVKDWPPGLVTSTGCQERNIGDGVNPSIAGNPSKKGEVTLSAGFSSICKIKDGGLRFVNLLDCLSNVYPQMRFRFTSPHPKDFPDELLFLMAERPNICNSIHLPAQSGSSTVLERMRRGYTREAYLALVNRVRDIVPDVSISSDFITGFCGETEEEHRDTLSLVEAVSYDMAYMFAYSMRDKTHAHRNYCDDVESNVKQRRLAELITTFRASSKDRYASLVGSTQLVLVEGPNKRNPRGELIGRSDMGHKVVFPNVPISVQDYSGHARNASGKAGDYVDVRILDTGLASLKGEAVLLKHGLSVCTPARLSI